MSNTVLAIIELDRFPQEVANRAAWIAELYGYDLELALNDPTLGFLRKTFMISAEAQHIRETVKEAQAQELEALETALKERGVSVTTRVLHDRNASDAIIERAVELDAAFVFKGTAYHSPAERARFTFTDWQLLHHLDYPLWLVKPHEWKEQPVLLAAVDPLHVHDKEGVLDQAVVEAGKSLAAKCDGELHLLHTYQELDAIGSYTKLKFNPKKVPLQDIEQRWQDEHRRHLDSLAARNEIDPEAIHMLPGRPNEVLPAFARQQGADLVIMGTMAIPGHKRHFVHSTAEQVIDHLPCDIRIERHLEPHDD